MFLQITFKANLNITELGIRLKEFTCFRILDQLFQGQIIIHMPPKICEFLQLKIFSGLHAPLAVYALFPAIGHLNL